MNFSKKNQSNCIMSNNFVNKKLFSTIVLPLFLLISAVVIVGSGCHAESKDEYYIDADGDGYGDSSADSIRFDETQGEEVGYVKNNKDCDDNNKEINPDAREIPNDGIDNDCDGGDTIEEGTDN